MSWTRIAPQVYYHPGYGKLYHSLRTESAWYNANDYDPEFSIALGQSVSVALRNAKQAIADRHDFLSRSAAVEAKARKRGKRRAISAVSKAVKAGLLARLRCEICDAEQAVAHHDDYAKPLEVRWLCRSHHAKWHATNGEGANAE